MKIQEIDKDFEEIAYYLNANGFKPFASCDGVLANHKSPNDVNTAYISFLKSSRIIDLMVEFLKNKENFTISLKSEGHYTPYEYYGNMIEGCIYSIYFSNRNGEKTEYVANIIRRIAESEEVQLSDEKRKLNILDRVLEENSDSDLVFEVIFNGEYQPYMNKSGRINKLVITTKAGNERIEGNIAIQTQRDMDALANILSEKYSMDKMSDNEKTYSETEFIKSSSDRCSIYFTDEHFSRILEQIEYSKQIAHTLPTFEAREWIGSEEELFEEYSDEVRQTEDVEGENEGRNEWDLRNYGTTKEEFDRKVEEVLARRKVEKEKKRDIQEEDKQL